MEPTATSLSNEGAQSAAHEPNQTLKELFEDFSLIFSSTYINITK